MRSVVVIALAANVARDGIEVGWAEQLDEAIAVVRELRDQVKDEPRASTTDAVVWVVGVCAANLLS